MWREPADVYLIAGHKKPRTALTTGYEPAALNSQDMYLLPNLYQERSYLVPEIFCACVFTPRRFATLRTCDRSEPNSKSTCVLSLDSLKFHIEPNTSQVGNELIEFESGSCLNFVSGNNKRRNTNLLMISLKNVRGWFRFIEIILLVTNKICLFVLRVIGNKIGS